MLGDIYGLWKRENVVCLHSGSNPAAANEIAAVLAQDSVH